MADLGMVVAVTGVNSNCTIGRAGQSVVLSWVSMLQASTATNAIMYFYKGTTTAAGNLVFALDIAPNQATEMVAMGDGWTSGIYCQDGCVVSTGANFSWANVGFRCSAG